MSSIKIPALNPFKFHREGTGDFDQNKIPFMEAQYAKYCQRYQIGDRFTLQFQQLPVYAGGGSGVYAPTVDLVDNTGASVKSFQVEQANVSYSGFNSFYVVDTFPTLAEGAYYIKLVTYIQLDPNGGAFYSSVFYSEPIWLKTTWENTSVINYGLDYNDFDCIFTDSQIPPFQMRIEAGVRSEGFQPGGKYTMFQDQLFEPVMLQSTPYNVYKWSFGPGGGIPNWLADKLNRIFACDQVTIDDVAYMRNEGAKLEVSRDASYPFGGWTIDLLKAENELSDEFDAVGTTNAFLASNDIILASNDTLLASAELY